MKQAPESNHPHARLLAIVEVDHDQRVRCGNPGCGHSVYKAVHVVQDGQELLVLGSTCFEKRYGLGALGAPHYGGGGGRRLTSDERELLLHNTQALLQQFEAEQEALRQKLLRIRAELSARKPVPSEATPLRQPQAIAAMPLVAQRGASPQSVVRGSAPWAWMKAGTSMAGFKLRDGTCWVRVQHRDGGQMLTPWPVFDGWDEWLPGHLGNPEHSLGAYHVGDVRAVIAFLRTLAVREKVSGVWNEIRALLSAGD